MTDLRDLNRRVTSAIFRAERAQEGSVEAEQAYREVSLLEEQIAHATQGSRLDGALARKGAVTAALRAGMSLRALSLATRYLEDDESTAELRVELEGLRQQAEAALPSHATEVRDVRFHIAA